MTKCFCALLLACLTLFMDVALAQSNWYHILDDSSPLNRAAEAFGVSKEYATFQGRTSPEEETSLTPAQIADKNRLIESYLTFMRTGQFASAYRAEAELKKYSKYLSIWDFDEVATKTFQGQREVDDIQFVLFPSFYKKVYSAVVKTLGPEYQQLWWPIGVYPITSSETRYYLIVVSYSSPRAVFLLDDQSSVLDVLVDREFHGGLCKPYSILPYLKVLDSELFSMNECGNCTNRTLYFVRGGRIMKVEIIHDKEKLPYSGPATLGFCEGCGTIGGGCDCGFVRSENGMEELVCSGYDHQTINGQDGYFRWTDKFRWNPEMKAFLHYDHAESREPSK